MCWSFHKALPIQGSGDSKALMLILAAESAISALAGPIQKNESIIGKTWTFISIMIQFIPS